MDDEARHEMDETLELLQEQMANLAAIHKKQAALTAKGTAADDTVEVTVDARGMVINTAIDESYLEDFEFEELGGHITSAAQAAVAEVGRRVAEIMEPLRERRAAFPSLSDIVDGAPDIRGLVDGFMSSLAADATTTTGGRDEGGSQGPAYPTVRS